MRRESPALMWLSAVEDDEEEGVVAVIVGMVTILWWSMQLYEYDRVFSFSFGAEIEDRRFCG